MISCSWSAEKEEWVNFFAEDEEVAREVYGCFYDELSNEGWTTKLFNSHIEQEQDLRNLEISHDELGVSLDVLNELETIEDQDDYIESRFNDYIKSRYPAIYQFNNIISRNTNCLNSIE
tara:strand:- start:182 stop:538 length:357 start_codon:yes stop_codon:yes gene_type:complete